MCDKTYFVACFASKITRAIVSINPQIQGVCTNRTIKIDFLVCMVKFSVELNPKYRIFLNSELNRIN